MNKKYEMPAISVQELDIEDLIATSWGDGLEEGENFGDLDNGYGELN